MYVCMYVTYGVLAHDSAASHLEIEAAGEGVAGDEEELLLETDVGLDALDVVANVLEEARALAAHRLHVHVVAASRVSIKPLHVQTLLFASRTCAYEEGEFSTATTHELEAGCLPP